MDRFYNKVKILDNGCHQWTARIRNGYGQFWLDGKDRQAHVVAWEWKNGSVPNGFQLDHTCHDPKVCSGGTTCPHRACVNPEHASPVTYEQNHDKDRAVHFERNKTHCPAGHEYNEKNTRMNGNRRVCIPCHARHGRDYRTRRKAKSAD